MGNGVIFAALSVVVTLLTSLFKTTNLSVKQKNLIATGLSVVAGAVTVWVNSDGDFSGTTIASVATATYGAAQLAYNFILKGTGLDKKLTNVNLFGVSPKVAEEVLKEVSKKTSTKKAVKKAPAKKASSTTTTKKTTK